MGTNRFFDPGHHSSVHATVGLHGAALAGNLDSGGGRACRDSVGRFRTAFAASIGVEIFQRSRSRPVGRVGGQGGAGNGGRSASSWSGACTGR